MDRAFLDRAFLVININRRLRDFWGVGTSQGERSSSRGDIWSWGPRLGVGEWWREGFFILFSLTSFYKLVFCASRCTEYQRKYSISERQAKDHQLLESLFSPELSLNFSRLFESHSRLSGKYATWGDGWNSGYSEFCFPSQFPFLGERRLSL